MSWGDLVAEARDQRTEGKEKSGAGRWVPMTPRLRQAMKEHFARYRFGGSPWVFHHTLRKRHAEKGARIRGLHRAFRSAAARAKLPPELRQHDLRHRRVTSWLAEGKNPVHVKEGMGHSTMAVTMGYTHLVREHLCSLVDGEAPLATGHA